MRTAIPFLLRLIFALAGASAAWTAEAAEPLLSISARGPVDQTFEQGEPWRVAVRLDLPRGSKETVKLVPANGTWIDAVSIELVPATGGAAVARAEPVGKAEVAATTLDAKHVAGGLWRFSPAAMQAVAPGGYVVRATLSIAGGSGWNGTVQSRAIALKVVAPATKPPVHRLVNEAHDLMLTGRLEEAAKAIDTALQAAPRDAALLSVRAQIAEQAGNPFAATICLNAANFSTTRKLNEGQPPAEDLEMQDRLAKARRAAVAGNAKPPEWTWPPAEVMTAFAAVAEQSGFISKQLPETNAAPAAGNTPVPTAAVVPTKPAAVPATAATASAPAPAPVPVALPKGVVVPAKELNDAKVSADSHGQWAASARAGSQYSNPNYGAMKAIGTPDVSVTGDSPSAWCPAAQGGGVDWLEVGFAKPVQATEVRVRQTNCPGAIVKIEAIEDNGATHVWWEGADPYVAPAVRDIAWFAVRVPKTDYLVAKVKITLNLAAVPGWKQIDAVQLVRSKE